MSNKMVSVPFKREDRYIVIKRSDLANVPVNYRSALVDPLAPLLAHLPSREYLVIESDWPEYEPTWAAIEARVMGKPAEQHQGKQVVYLCKAEGAKWLQYGSKVGDPWEPGEVQVTPLYTHADPGDADDLLAATSLEFGGRLDAVEQERDTLRAQLERLAEANLHCRNLQIEADDLIKFLREQLSEIQQAARAVFSARDADDCPHGHPGHCHEVRGQWNSSGAPCQNCAAYDRLEALMKLERVAR